MRAWHVALGLALAVAAVLVSPDPAGAHGVAGIQPSNYETRVLRIQPAVPGLTVRVDDLGNKLALDNGTGREITVLGYDNEPYLRVGPAGVFQNVRSPAVYLNKTRNGTTRVPASASATAPPVWQRVGSGTTVRWHDHRAHWLGAGDPPQVQQEPGSFHEVLHWTVTLVRAGAPIAVHGDVVWVPGPSPWPWVALAAACAALLLALAATRLARVAVAAALGAMIVGETAHVLGTWAGTTVGGATKLAASAYALGGIAVAILALVWVVRRGLGAAAPLLLLAGLFLALAGGLADVTVLYRSQLPTTLAHAWARAEVAVVIGLGIGVAVIGAWRLRAAPRRVASAPPARTPVGASRR